MVELMCFPAQSFARQTLAPNENRGEISQDAVVQPIPPGTYRCPFNIGAVAGLVNDV